MHLFQSKSSLIYMFKIYQLYCAATVTTVPHYDLTFILWFEEKPVSCQWEKIESRCDIRVVVFQKARLYYMIDLLRKQRQKYPLIDLLIVFSLSICLSHNLKGFTISDHVVNVWAGRDDVFLLTTPSMTCL